MPTVIIKGKMTKGYDHWLAAFEGLEERRDRTMASGLFIVDRIYRKPIRFIWSCSLHRWKCCKVTWRTKQY